MRFYGLGLVGMVCFWRCLMFGWVVGGVVWEGGSINRMIVWSLCVVSIGGDGLVLWIES